MNKGDRVLVATDATQRSPAQPEPAVPDRTTPTFPLPAVYGVYALSDGRLHELEPLTGRVPDQRIFMSAAIKKPSRAILPDGRVQFIVFRRDIAHNAPDRVSIRVIAKIARAMTFSAAGKATMSAVEAQWTIRGNSYEYRVAPLNNNPEMLVMSPEDSDFLFPSGRYGLVLNGQAYDFTVAGEVTDPAQCLEQTEAANGTFYSECRTR
jgi:hypothetical protein